MPRINVSLTSIILCLSFILLPLLAQGEQRPLAEVKQGTHAIEWRPAGGHWRVTLRVSDSVGVIAEKTYGPEERIVFPVAGRPDGQYGWELMAEPIIHDSITRAMENAAEDGQRHAFHDDVKREGAVPLHPTTQSGTFTIVDGLAALPHLEEEGVGLKFRQAIVEDLFVKGSVCVGLDCPTSNLNFSFVTLLISENNTRIKFDDTSGTGSFPNNDWELVANDSTNGGANKFVIRDCGVSSQVACSGTDPFTVEAGARNNALYVRSSGDVGMGTKEPVLELHIVGGDSPSIRLDQQGGGFTPQAWDIAGNETNFFVRDVTNGSKLPFKIQPGAPDNTLYLSNAGYVGVGKQNPDSKMHMEASDDNSADANKVRYYAKNTSTVEQNRAMAYLTNNGGVAVYYEDTSSSLRWQTLAADGEFFISRLGSGGSEFTLDDTGNLEITGTLTQGSDRNSKRDIETVNVDDVLQRVASLPISTWSYKKDEPGTRHMGPMAQDFHAAFGLGDDERRIATIDTSGVALASIQALHLQIEALKAELANVRAELAASQDDE